MEFSNPDTARTIIMVVCGFILAINLSLVFAFLHRKRDMQTMQSQRRGRAPWESRLDEPTAELSRRVAELRENAHEQPPNEGKNSDQPDTK